jgi:nitroreductase
MSHIKTAETKSPILDIIAKRWSPRAFSNQDITDETLNTILEAASWSFSANNEQPWRYIVAKRGTETFQKISELFTPGNKTWAPNAAALMISVIKTTFARDNSINKAAMHDVGAANAHLAIEARAHNVFTHFIGGFDKNKAKEVFNLPEGFEPIACIALGYLGSPEQLNETLKPREEQPRERKPLSEFVLNYGEK